MTQRTLNDQRSQSQITGLLLPLQNEQRLLIPNITIAELAPRDTPYGQLENSDRPWYEGELSWRGQQIPVIRWEVLSGQAAQEDSEDWRFAVLNSLFDDYSGHFYALKIQGIPRMLRVEEGDLAPQSGVAPAAGALFSVDTESGPALIPDLQWLEKQLQQN